MVNLTVTDADELAFALGYIAGYLTDNSCGDPECCGDPYYNRDDAVDYLSTLNKFGLTIEID